MENKQTSGKPNFIEILFVALAFQIYIYSVYLIPGTIILTPILGALFAAYFFKRQGAALVFMMEAIIVGIVFELPIALVIIFGLSPVIVGVMTRAKARLELVTMISAFAVLSGMIALVYWLKTTTTIDFNALLTDATEQYILTLEEAVLFSGETLEILKQNIYQYVDVIKELWLALIVIVAILFAVIQSYLTRVFINLFKWEKLNIKSIFYYSLPKSTLLFFVLCYLVMEVSNNEMINFVTYTLVAVVLFIISCSGITFCIYSIIKSNKTGVKIALGILTPLVVLLFPILMTFVGGVDTAFQRRRLS
jgi:hypothetical protein